MARNVVPLAMTKVAALRILRECAEQTERVVILPHAEARMKKRHITRMQVITCLRLGSITEGPSWSAVHGSWELRVERMTAGDRVSVGAAIDLKARVLIITAF